MDSWAGSQQGNSMRRSRLGTVPRWEQWALELREGKEKGSFQHKDQLWNVEMLPDNFSGVFRSQAKSFSCLVKLRNLGRPLLKLAKSGPCWWLIKTTHLKRGRIDSIFTNPSCQDQSSLPTKDPGTSRDISPPLQQRPPPSTPRDFQPLREHQLRAGLGTREGQGIWPGRKHFPHHPWNFLPCSFQLLEGFCGSLTYLCSSEAAHPYSIPLGTWSLPCAIPNILSNYPQCRKKKFPYFSTTDSLIFTSKCFFNGAFLELYPHNFPYMLTTHHLIFLWRCSFSTPEILSSFPSKIFPTYQLQSSSF